jgi:16S rRNA (adenine1518-N6/adenine1519-N6)-dimethyltransferase
MSKVKPKKYLGQHFLKDANIAGKVAGSLTGTGYESVLEIGPGTGMLTRKLLELGFPDLRVVEIDGESVGYLRDHLPELKNIIEGDFLLLDIDSLFSGRLAVTGNFPYNISSQIFFKVLNHRHRITEVCGMLQKEVAERICASPGSRTYGILSVLLQAYYRTEYLFSVPPHVFSPAPKVHSGVIRLIRNDVKQLECDESLFFRVVKTCFNQRRKTLRNSVRAGFRLRSDDYPEFNLRPEQLTVDQFVRLTLWIKENSL